MYEYGNHVLKFTFCMNKQNEIDYELTSQKMKSDNFIMFIDQRVLKNVGHFYYKLIIVLNQIQLKSSLLQNNP